MFAFHRNLSCTFQCYQSYTDLHNNLAKTVFPRNGEITKIILTNNFLDVFPVRFQDDAASLKLLLQVGEDGEGGGGDEGFAPPLAPVLHVLLVLHPPGDLPPLVRLLHEPGVELDEHRQHWAALTTFSEKYYWNISNIYYFIEIFLDWSLGEEFGQF